MGKKVTIKSNKRLLAVEGKDEYNFFEKLLKKLNIEDVKVIDIGGKSKFPDRFKSLYNTDGFKSIKQIGFVRDAEENPAQSAFASICGILRDSKLPTPSKPNEIIKKDGLNVGIFIMPNNEEVGMLEDLCLKTIENDPINDCIEDYIQCFKPYQKENEKIYYNESKTRVQTYLAARSPIVNSLGLGAAKDYWDFDHQCFDDIKNFIKELFMEYEHH